MNPEQDAQANPPMREMLDAYLDGAAGPDEAARLLDRAAGEPDLAAALARLRAERALRLAAWQSMEPDDPAVERLVAGVRSDARRQDLRLRVLRLARVATAAAACAACFLGGWSVRGRLAPDNGVNSVAVKAAGPGGNEKAVGMGNDSSLPGSTANVPPAPAPVVEAARARPQPPRRFQVALTDEFGNVIAVQSFKELHTARQFAADVGRLYAAQEQARRGHALVVSEAF